MSTTVKPTTSDELEAELSVVKDTGNKVILAIKVPGLKKRKGFFRLCCLFRKHVNPFKLAENVKFGEYNLSNTSLTFSVQVYESKRTMKKPGSTRQKYSLRILQFPSRINPESAVFELEEAISGNCYFLMTCIKLDNLSTNWKEFLATHSTLDMTKLSHESS